MNNKEQAMQKFLKLKYNCCQAVVCTYCEECNLDEKAVFKMTEGFGSGMGGLRDTCGAVVGMFLTLGMINSAGNMQNPFETKDDTYERLRDMANIFKKKCGSIYCRDLKNNRQISCKNCVETAVDIIDMYLKKNLF